jgi:hypothetical protein
MNNIVKMYGKTNDEVSKRKTFNASQKHHVILQDDIELQVPTLDYVKRLEQNQVILLNKIEVLEKKLKQQASNSTHLRSHVTRHAKKISSMETDMNNKVDFNY